VNITRNIKSGTLWMEQTAALKSVINLHGA
jgi:hypothetical protein